MDDTLVCCDDDMNQLGYLGQVLSSFQVASGPKINLSVRFSSREGG